MQASRTVSSLFFSLGHVAELHHGTGVPFRRPGRSGDKPQPVYLLCGRHLPQSQKR